MLGNCRSDIAAIVQLWGYGVKKIEDSGRRKEVSETEEREQTIFPTSVTKDV